MTFNHYVLRPRLRDLLLTFLVHKNPFYLLSALSMVAGCYAINSGLSPRPGESGKLLPLLALLNAYEFVLIGLGLFLIRRRGILRDGRTLLLIQAPFLADLMFLNGQAGSIGFQEGFWLDAVALALACIKVTLVLRSLGALRRSTFVFILIELAALFMLPTLFKWVEHSRLVTGREFYLAWWGVGALLVSYEVQARWLTSTGAQTRGVGLLMRRIYLALPIVSLIAHLGMMHWVYRVDFAAADLSPVLFGFAIALGRASPKWLPIRVMLSILAASLSLDQAYLLRVPIGLHFMLTPGTLTLGLLYAGFVYSFFLKRAVYLLGGAALVLLMMANGPLIHQALQACMEVAQRCWRRGARMLPETATQWGVLAVGGSFAFLGLGAALSLRQREPQKAPDGLPPL